MKYLIAIEPGDASHAFGVVVPDLPGCFSAGDTFEEAVDNAREAIELWLEATIEDGGDIPPPQAASEHYANPDFADWTWAFVEDIGITP
ncbi:MAG: type II toxin-antitoxin system HicB family antitoxin [Duganella sp.]